MKSGMRIKKSFLLASISAVATYGYSCDAQAQTVQLPVAPVNSVVDARGVDVASGNLAISTTPLSIGGSTSGLKYSLFWAGAG